MPQSRNDDPNDRSLDVRPRLVENEEIETLTLGDAHARSYLLIGVEKAELDIEIGFAAAVRRSATDRNGLQYAAA